MIDWADLAARRFSFFAVRPRSKLPQSAWAQYRKRTPTTSEIEDWSKDRQLNAAIVTGKISGIFVVDIDSEAALTTFLERGVPQTTSVKTANGVHYYFKYPNFVVRNSVGKIMPNLDIRGEGGYVIAPGSVHPSGHKYHWLNSIGPANAPEWLLTQLSGTEFRCGATGIQAALEAQCEVVSRAQKGTRNNTLNNAALSLGHLIGAGVLPREEAVEALVDAAHKNGYVADDGEVAARKTIDSGIRKGISEPRLPHVRVRLTAPGSADGGPLLSRDPAEDSEIALAETFSAAYSETWRYVAAMGRWLEYRDGVWLEDQNLKVLELSRCVVANASARLKLDRKHKQAKALATAKTVAAVISLARADRRHAATIDQWDRDPWLLNTPEGTADLRTGSVRPHDATDYCSKRTAVAPAPCVPSDCHFVGFLNRVCDGDRALMDYLKRAAGYSLTGLTNEEVFFFIFGLGQNGKSKFLEAMTGTIGSYHEYSSIDTFTANPFDRHPTDLAKLKGARLVTAVETEEGRRWAEARIKSLTGGDPVSARFMRQDFFTYQPQFKLWIAGNHKPELRNVDLAMRRRLNLIPFVVTIPESERDRHLSQKLKAERPIILRWMLDGCLEWQRVGLGIPAAISQATASYVAEEDRVAQWLEQSCIVSQNLRERFDVLWHSWKCWAEAAGEFVGSKNRLGRALQERGFIPQHTRDGRVYVGLSADRSRP